MIPAKSIDRIDNISSDWNFEDVRTHSGFSHVIITCCWEEIGFGFGFGFVFRAGWTATWTADDFNGGAVVGGGGRQRCGGYCRLMVELEILDLMKFSKRIDIVRVVFSFFYIFFFHFLINKKYLFLFVSLFIEIKIDIIEIYKKEKKKRWNIRSSRRKLGVVVFGWREKRKKMNLKITFPIFIYYIYKRKTSGGKGLAFMVFLYKKKN